MIIKQSDLFWEMRHELIKNIMNISKKEVHDKESYLFHEGDAAKYFYVLLTGRIRLIIGEPRQSVYIVDKAGESFGWSSLIGRPEYTATAECLESTKVLRFNSIELLRLVTQDPADGMIFFQRLSSMLGHRLLRTYGALSDMARSALPISHGTGQVIQWGLEV